MPPPEPSELIGHMLFEANQAFGKDLVARLHAAGYPDIRFSHAAVFSNLDPAGTTATVLARRAGMTKVAMGKLVMDLESKGYLRRDADPVDGRAKVVRLTERGERHARAAVEAIAAIGEDYAARLGAEQLALLVSLLQQLMAKA